MFFICRNLNRELVKREGNIERMRGTATAVEIEGMDDTEQTVLLFLLVVVRWYFENCCPLQMTKQAAWLRRCQHPPTKLQPCIYRQKSPKFHGSLLWLRLPGGFYLPHHYPLSSNRKMMRRIYILNQLCLLKSFTPCWSVRKFRKSKSYMPHLHFFK